MHLTQLKEHHQEKKGAVPVMNVILPFFFTFFIFTNLFFLIYSLFKRMKMSDRISVLVVVCCTQMMLKVV